MQTAPRTNPDQLNHVFGALSDPTRRAIVARLSKGSATIATLATEFPMSLPAVSKHVRVLERAGIARREKKGREFHLRLEPDPLEQAEEWIAFYRHFWSTQLDALEDFLKSTKRKARNK